MELESFRHPFNYESQPFWLAQIAQTLIQRRVKTLMMAQREQSLTAEQALLGIAEIRAYDDFRIEAERLIRQHESGFEEP